MRRAKKFKKVGEAFEQLYRKKGFQSAYELSKESGLGRDYISKVVNGSLGKPGPEKIKQIAEAFAKKSGFSVDDEIAELTKLFANDGNSFNEEEEERSLSENTPKNDAQPVEKISSLESNFPEINNSQNDIDALVKNIKNKRDEIIKFQCGKLHTLYTRDIEINKIYTDVNILENLTNERWLEISDLVKIFKPGKVNSEKFDRLGWSKTLVRKSGLEVLEVVEKSQNLMLLGKPGSGKTTFLKRLAIKCNDNEDKFLSDRLPIFITLKQLSDDENLDNKNFDFLDYFFTKELLGICEKEELEKILSCGKALILLDGLDEVVPAKKAKQLAKYIQYFANSSRYYQNKFIISCRIAAQEYRFEKFDYIEVADFNEVQVKNFVENWFVAVDSKSPENGMANAQQFLEKIQLPENKQIQELAVTPILLNLACVVFQDRLDFPSKRYKLYEEGLDILLGKWDKNRGIKRDEVYKNLSVLHKKELLTQVAAATFETGDYFFESEKVQKLIAEYLHSFSDSNQDKIQLQLDSEAVLNSLEAQHGLLIERANKIYSFSHLTFHEYFTAKKIIASSDSFIKSVNHAPENRWRDIFLLVVDMLKNADKFLLLMKEEMDNLLASDDILQRFLKWGYEKANSINLPLMAATIRAFYLEIEEECSSDDTRRAVIYSNSYWISNLLELRGLDTNNPDYFFYYFSAEDYYIFENSIILDKKLQNIFTNAYYWCCNIHFEGIKYILQEIEYILNLDLEPNFKDSFQYIKNKLPSLEPEEENIKQWWQENSYNWIQELRAIMMKYRNIGHDWQFTQEQMQFSEEKIELLQKYYDANSLLIDCLNTNSNVSPEVREEIEETLLLPVEEIEKWKQLHRPKNS